MPCSRFQDALEPFHGSDQFRADARDLENVSLAVREKAARLEIIETGKRTERQKILAESKARKRVLDRLAGDIRASRREIKVLVADELRLARLVEEIGRVLSSKPGAGCRQQSPVGHHNQEFPGK